MAGAGRSTSSPVEAAAALIVRAHREHRIVDAPPLGGWAPTLDEAYAIQDRVAQALGGAGGWKTGAPAPDVEPIAAPVLVSRIGSAPAALDAGRFHLPGIEAEFAFRFARALRPRTRPYERDEVVRAIGALVPAIEVVDSRLGAWSRDSATWKLADNQSNGFLVCGDDVVWRGDVDLVGFPVELWIDGACAVRGADSANPAGDPLRLATWLVNHLARSGRGVEAGTVVTTGSYTGLRRVRPGQRVVARYPGIGEVALELTP